MKKPRTHHRIWSERRNRIITARQLRDSKAYLRTARKKRDYVKAPSYFNILPTGPNESAEACSLFFDFLQYIRQYKSGRLCIDLSGVARLQATATLLFKSEVSHLISRGVYVTAVPPRKERSNEVLTQTGIASMLGIPEMSQVSREDTIHWRHASGPWSGFKPQSLAPLLSLDDSLSDSMLYSGLLESVGNAIEHAYQEHPARRKFKNDENRWWGFQQYRDGYLTSCICDLGIGISNALPIKLSEEPGLYQKLLFGFRQLKGKDVQSILAAIEYGRTGTHLEERGKGMRDAHSVVDGAGEGILQIYSNKGLYTYTRKPGKADASKVTRRLPRSIHGTIYVWRFPIQLERRVSEVPTLGDET